ncbi:MAG: DUF6491 family protein [Rhizomicrobium sp.]
MKLPIFIFASALGLALTGAAARADEPPAPTKAPACFLVSNFENWKAADAKTINVRVNLHQYYRLDLAASCPALLWPSAYLITEWHGTNSVCSAIDWDIKVAQSPGGIQSACIVKTMTPLTSAEAAAIPKKFKP